MAKCGTKTRRIDTLAQSKTIPDEFIEDCQSIYDNNTISKKWDGGDASTKFAVTGRLEQLVIAKPLHKEWTAPRPSPIWLVSKSAQNAKPSAHLDGLSGSKKLHPDYEPRKSVYTSVSQAAKNASPSARLESLAKAKDYVELPVLPDGNWDYSYWQTEVSPAALNHVASNRLSELANAKEFHKDHREQKPVVWTVSTSAKKTLPTLRLEQLARAKSRSKYKEDYDPSWYLVTPGARHARPTPRLAELSLPLPRKTRQKRQAAVKL